MNVNPTFHPQWEVPDLVPQTVPASEKKPCSSAL